MHLTILFPSGSLFKDKVTEDFQKLIVGKIQILTSRFILDNTSCLSSNVFNMSLFHGKILVPAPIIML